MAKSDNNGQKLFGTEFNGFNKKQVTEYIASLENKYNASLKQKETDISSLENSYNELQDKYAELFDSYMVLQEEKSKIADVLIGAENRAGEIIEQAKHDAEKERSELEAQSELLREAIVDKNKILKNMKDSANALVAEFEALMDSKVKEMRSMLDSGIAELNSKVDLVITDTAAKNEAASVPDKDDSADGEIYAVTELSDNTDDVVPNEVTGIFEDEDEKKNDGDMFL
ncbi:MAG: hypothetical protein IJZ94_04715 [Clostridia bacterium]|nr:hypothetical protein [Clostridia bacterium]MBQ8165098.1 hypothetical protein [Clostridia bacterium]